MIELKKQYGPEHPPVKISDSVEDFVSIIVLTKEGELEVYNRVDGPEFKRDEKRQYKSTEGPGRAKKSLAPDGHEVKISSFMSMVGSPGCKCVNGTEWYW